MSLFKKKLNFHGGGQMSMLGGGQRSVCIQVPEN
jgi:hypothetical protein